MTPFQNQSPTLTYDVFALKRPGLTRDLPPGTESLQWTANTATLIAGSQDAVLGDTFATIDQNRQLVDWMKKSGKNLTTIYITHAHGDHAFGIKILLDHFPHARAVAAPAVAKAMHAQIDPDYLNNFWETRFPGQIPEPLVVPEALDSNEVCSRRAETGRHRRWVHRYRQFNVSLRPIHRFGCCWRCCLQWHSSLHG